MSKINVKAKPDRGFWRAGMFFTRAGTDLDVTELTEAQLAAIKSEQNLVVTQSGESDAEIAKREKAEAAEAARLQKAEAAEAAKLQKAEVAKAAQAQAELNKLNGQAKGRQKQATKTAEGHAAWVAAEAQARTVWPMSDESWASLAEHDRIDRIEQQLPNGKAK